VKLGHCDVAITYYEKYLATNPPDAPAQATNEAIGNCKQQLAAQDAASQPATPATDTTTATVSTGSASTTSSGHEFDVLGAGIAGAGLVSTVVGIVLYSSARGDLDDAESAATYQDSAGLVDDAHSKRTYAVVFGVVGVAAIGVGTWHFLHHRKAEHDSSSVTVAPTAHGGLVTWGGSF
jgi:hypothetical protein